MSDSSELSLNQEENVVTTTTPVGSPRLELQKLSVSDNTTYQIPPSILKRLTPVSPQKRRHSSDKGVRQELLEERKRKLKEYSMRVDKINKHQKWEAEKKRRYSNETLQRKLDNAHERRVKSYSAKSKRASESFKVIQSDDSLSKATVKTKSILRNSEIGIINQHCTFATKKNLVAESVCRYLVKQKIEWLLESGIFNIVTDPNGNRQLTSLLTSQKLIESISFIFRNLRIPMYNDNKSKLLLQGFQYVLESYSSDDGIMNGLVTTVPKTRDREPFKTVFDNKLNGDLIALLIQISKQLIIAFKFYIRSNLSRFNHQYLIFVKLWKKFNDLNSIFIKFHSMRCIWNLNYSIEILLRSQQMLKLKLKDHAFATVRQDLMKDIHKYDLDMKKLQNQLVIFKNDVKIPAVNDLYFIGKVLKENKKVYGERDMYPTFLKSMNNWRKILVYEESNNSLQLNKGSCHVLNEELETTRDFYLSKYSLYCRLLNLENFLETLPMDQELTEFGVRICDFLNYSLNADRVFPPLDLTILNFKEFFQRIILHGFKDILTVDDAHNYNRILSNLDTIDGIQQAKDFLIELVRSSLSFIINSNLPNDKILFERYQFGRKFEILNCPLLVERSFEVIQREKSVLQLIMMEIFERVRDENYQLIETLQMFDIVIQKQVIPLFSKAGEIDKVKSYLMQEETGTILSDKKEELLNLKRLLTKMIELNMRYYEKVYAEVWQYLRDNWVN